MPDSLDRTAGHPTRRTLVFDVNETLLDLGMLRPRFAELFGDAAALDRWFTQLLLYSQVATLAGPYATFGDIADASLQMLAQAEGIELPSAARRALVGGLSQLPPHPDVVPALDALQAAGFRMVTLSNSAPAALDTQLHSAGLGTYFERRFSVDAVHRFKPAPDVYASVSAALGVAPSQLRLVAAHAWDIQGALRAGMAAAFVARPGKVLYPLGDSPDIVGATLTDVAAAIIARDGAAGAHHRP